MRNYMLKNNYLKVCVNKLDWCKKSIELICIFFIIWKYFYCCEVCYFICKIVLILININCIIIRFGFIKWKYWWLFKKDVW